MAQGDVLWHVASLGAVVLLGSLAAMASAAKTPPAPRVVSSPRIVAYVPNWIDLAAFAKALPYDKVTQINLAFENPTDDNGTLSFNPQDAGLIAAAHAHQAPVFLSIGGGSASSDPVLLKRYAALLGDAQRPAFVAALAAYLDQHGFDGLDVDLEGPMVDAQYGAFVHDLAGAVHARGKTLTAALSPGYGAANAPRSVFADLDFVNIMAYDAVGTWDPNAPGQHSSLAFAEGCTQYFLGRGLPARKAVLGVPFYGYGFGKAFRNWSYPYAEILAAYPDAARADQVGSTIWYNGIPTLQAKARYALSQHLAGVMIWSLDNDAPGPNSLLTALASALHTPNPVPNR